nr:retrovirus-related Pol polyprotein from transposon TNT 1-94 [Tanacetum cinerariifolium]
MYKDTLKDSGAGNDKFVEELQFKVELQRLNNHTLEEDQTDQEDDDDEDAGDQETNQTSDLRDYQLVQDREPRTRKKPWRKDGFFEEEQDLRVSGSSSWAKAVVRHTSIQVILALTACKDYELEQLDVTTTFLHGNLKEVIYMRQPPGYEQDDTLIACKSKAEIGSTKSLLKKEFDMKELEETKKILGMEIVRDRSRKIMRVRDYSVRDCDVQRKSKVPYANVVGSLMYLMVCTRPDIAYATSVVSKYLANMGKIHWEAVKWILKYLRGTANMGLVYGTDRGNEWDQTSFVDSD